MSNLGSNSASFVSLESASVGQEYSREDSFASAQAETTTAEALEEELHNLRVRLIQKDLELSDLKFQNDTEIQRLRAEKDREIAVLRARAVQLQLVQHERYRILEPALCAAERGYEATCSIPVVGSMVQLGVRVADVGVRRLTPWGGCAELHGRLSRLAPYLDAKVITPQIVAYRASLAALCGPAADATGAALSPYVHRVSAVVGPILVIVGPYTERVQAVARPLCKHICARFESPSAPTFSRCVSSEFEAFRSPGRETVTEVYDISSNDEADLDEDLKAMADDGFHPEEAFEDVGRMSELPIESSQVPSSEACTPNDAPSDAVSGPCTGTSPGVALGHTPEID